MRKIETHFIPENVAPVGTKHIVVMQNDANGNPVRTVGRIPLGGLAVPALGDKLYSFGVISDLHVFNPETGSYKDDTTANGDYERALKFYNNNADFLCQCGDLVGYVNKDIATYKSIQAKIQAEDGHILPIYSVSGNHENWGLLFDETTLGFPLYYSFTQGNDVFIMVGFYNWTEETDRPVFTQEELQWLYETLEENRNKRCFVFQHSNLHDGDFCGNPLGLHTGRELKGNSETVFKSLMAHYKNSIFFHGHTHTLYEGQEVSPIANYDKTLGSHSLHVPSLAMPYDVRSGTREPAYGQSQGGLIDVYPNHIVHNGLDFANGKIVNGIFVPAIVPMATYCLDTTLLTVDGKTYSDSTGTIIT